MRLCLHCRAVGPDAPRCGHCGRSFGARLCARDHASPLDAVRCVHCGREELTEGTRYLSLTPLSRLLAWALALGLLSLVTHHLGPLLAGVLAMIVWGAAHVLNLGAVPWVCLLDRLLFWVLFVLLVSLALPPAWGRAVRGWLGQALRHGLRWLVPALSLAGRVFYRLVEGPEKEDARPGKKKARKKR